jgi:hypothetical protein
VPWTFALKIGSLLSFCGGPLVLFDLLSTHLNKNAAFAISFTPNALLIFGVFSLKAEVPGCWDRAAVWAGLWAAAALLGINGWGACELTTGSTREDAGLVQLGLAVGFIFVGYYAWAAHRFLGPSRRLLR